jgi:hypothetical protein
MLVPSIKPQSLAVPQSPASVVTRIELNDCRITYEVAHWNFLDSPCQFPDVEERNHLQTVYSITCDHLLSSTRDIMPSRFPRYANLELEPGIHHELAPEYYKHKR